MDEGRPLADDGALQPSSRAAMSCKPISCAVAILFLAIPLTCAHAQFIGSGEPPALGGIAPLLDLVTTRSAPFPPASLPADDPVCRGLSHQIDAATITPSRGSRIAQSSGPRGESRIDLKEFDRRADLEQRYREHGCPTRR